MTHWLFECEGPSRESLWCVCMRVSHFGLCRLCGRVPWMSDFPATSTEKPVLILPSRATASPRTAGNADDHLTHSETISSIWGQINMQRKSPCGPFPWMLFPALLSSCCPVTRCRGRQVYLVWQVTLHPEPPQSHVKLTLMHQQLPSYGGQNTIMLKCITHFYELFSCIMLLPSPLLAGACRGMDLPRLIPLWMPGLIPLLLPLSPGCQVPNSPQYQPRWAPFLMRQETLKEYKSLCCIRLPSSPGDGGRRDKQRPAQRPAIKTLVVNINR